MREIYSTVELRTSGYVRQDEGLMVKDENGTRKYFKQVGKYTYKFSHSEPVNTEDISDILSED